MAKNIDVVVIHGSHKSLGADAPAKVGDTVSLGVTELKSLDPQFSFKKGIGERFATPAAAEKLNLKRQLEDELDAVDEDELDEAEDAETAEPAADAAPTPPAAPAAKAKGERKKKGG